MENNTERALFFHLHSSPGMLERVKCLMVNKLLPTYLHSSGKLKRKLSQRNRSDKGFTLVRRKNVPLNGNTRVFVNSIQLTRVYYN